MNLHFFRAQSVSSSAVKAESTDIGNQLVTAICPLGLNQICHLTGHSQVTVSEARDSKGTVYYTAAVLAPGTPQRHRASVSSGTNGWSAATGPADATQPNSARPSSALSDSVSPCPQLDLGRCSIAALSRHGKKFVVAALRGQIWFAELSGDPSSEVERFVFNLKF